MIQPKHTNTILYCSDWESAIAFYATTLGFPVLFQSDWFVEFALNPGASIAVADARRTSVPAGCGEGITISWRVADLDRARRELENRGVKLGGIREQWGGRGSFFHDPAGNRIEIWEPIKKNSRADES